MVSNLYIRNIQEKIINIYVYRRMNNLQVDINDFALDAPVVTKIEMEVMEMVLDSHVTMVVHYLNAN